MTSDGDDALIHEFLVESYENLDQLDNDLVKLEQNPDQRDVLSSIFRTIHTLKGTAGFLGFTKLELLAHAGENLLSRLRDGEMAFNQEIASALLATVDATREMLASIEETQTEGKGQYAHLVERLVDLLKSGGASAESGDTPATADPAEQAAAAEPSDPPAAGDEPEPPEAAAQSEAAAEPEVAQAESKAPARRESQASESSIRVDVGLLDKLMNLVGELVLARNQLLQQTTGAENVELQRSSQRLNLITTELQEGVMKTRMQPIGNIWNKFPRVVRDLSASCGKSIRLEMKGKETELDRTIIEAIKDPLTHIVRNAADHGIELPDDRKAAGKPRSGTLTLRAFHEGGQVNIEISDDGKGIDAEAVKAKAVRQGLITSDRASSMSEREALQLIFSAGLSTAAKVTNISGRGVGMDVVKTNIERIGGTIDLSSTPGQGTVLKIKIPLTLAIIPALLVNCGGDRYAIPQVSLLELVRLEGEQVRNGIELINGAPVYRLRGRLLPLVDLRETLRAPEDPDNDRDVINIVVLQADGRPFGLIVESVHDTEEIVVKPLGPQLKSLTMFAGGAIMGDGRVALILDVFGLAHHTGVLGEHHHRPMLAEDHGAHDSQGSFETMLVFALGDKGQAAIPLSDVARLEEFPADKVEWAGGREVVQYRGDILPLLRLTQELGEVRSGADAESLSAVVYSRGDRRVGLIVDNIIDIVAQAMEIRGNADTRLRGSAVVLERVTDIVDVEGVVRRFDPSFFDQTTEAA